MWDGWSDYFFMIGSSAGVLIGLMFVVVTLTAGRDRSETERGKHLYTSPVVWHLGVVLALSGMAIAPTVSAKLFGTVGGSLGLLGIWIGLRSAIGIGRVPHSPATAFDSFWYGVAPAIAYVGLVAAAFGVLRGLPWGPSAVAADLMALLLVSIHAEWDLVTYLAPMAGGSGNEKGG